jgi:Fe-S cluster biogenesis protein NfuA
MLLSRIARTRPRPPALQGWRRLMFIQTAQTPNPDSLKFLPGKTVLESGTREYKSFREAQASPLGKRLFQVEGVVGVMLATDFIAVSKAEESDWVTLKPQLFASIMDFYAAGEEADGSGEGEVDSLEILDDDTEVVQMIKELLDMRIRPSVQDDGGDIKFHGFNEETGVVSLEMMGSCSGCPSSSVTLKSGIENMLMHYIPEVKEVENIADAAMEDEGVLK